MIYFIFIKEKNKNVEHFFVDFNTSFFPGVYLKINKKLWNFFGVALFINFFNVGEIPEKLLDYYFNFTI